MDLESLWEIDRRHIAQIEEAKKKCREHPLSFSRPGVISPNNDEWENALKERDRAIKAHRDCISSIFS